MCIVNKSYLIGEVTKPPPFKRDSPIFNPQSYGAEFGTPQIQLGLFGVQQPHTT